MKTTACRRKQTRKKEGSIMTRRLVRGGNKVEKYYSKYRGTTINKTRRKWWFSFYFLTKINKHIEMIDHYQNLAKNHIIKYTSCNNSDCEISRNLKLHDDIYEPFTKKLPAVHGSLTRMINKRYNYYQMFVNNNYIEQMMKNNDYFKIQINNISNPDLIDEERMYETLFEFGDKYKTYLKWIGMFEAKHKNKTPDYDTPRSFNSENVFKQNIRPTLKKKRSWFPYFNFLSASTQEPSSSSFTLNLDSPSRDSPLTSSSSPLSKRNISPSRSDSTPHPAVPDAYTIASSQKDLLSPR